PPPGPAPPVPPVPPLGPLPPLRDDPALPQEGDVHLAVVLPDGAVAASIEGADLDLGGGSKTRVVRASGSPSALTLAISGMRAAIRKSSRPVRRGTIPVTRSLFAASRRRPAKAIASPRQGLIRRISATRSRTPRSRCRSRPMP